MLIKIGNKKGNEKRYLPPIVNIAAIAKDKYTVIFLIVRAIFFVLD